MNSHQRRKERKLWRYHVEVSFAHFMYRDEEIEYYMEIFDWCKKNFGDNAERCGWRDRWDGGRWEFNCPKKAALFALRWSGK